MLLKNRTDELKNILKRDNILSSPEELYCYSQDATNTNQENRLPDIVVFAESIEDVQKIVKYASAKRIPIVCRGAGTNMVGACACTHGGIVLNFSKMNKILDFNVENMTMTVQPGVVLNDIKKLAESQGLFYPPDPSNYKVSTIGGSIAQSSGGAMSFKYGTTKDYILSLTVVLADGTLIKLGAGTLKDAVGYHLNQLIVGSEGTLAIVVEAELKLIPKPEASNLITAYYDSIFEGINGVNAIIKDRVFPSTIDFMDRNAISTVEEFYPCNLDTNRECMLLIEIDGYESSLDTQYERINNALESANAVKISRYADANEKERIWTARRSSFAATAKMAPDVVTDDIIVPRSSLAEMVNTCREIYSRYHLDVSIVGHVGDGNIHPQVALNLDDENQFKNYMNAKAEIYATVKKLGGTISAEHGIGIEKLSYMEDFSDSTSINYMKKIKALFDPLNILNPGKIFEI